MAIATQTNTAPFGAITIHNIVSRLAAVPATLVDWRKSRSTRVTLHSLSDDVLADIGVSRWDINNIIR